MIFVCRSFVVSSHNPSEAVKVAAERGKWSGKWQQVFQAFLALDAANDLAILLVPIRTAFTLQMARRAKVELVGVFALGGFVVVTNVVRIVEFYTRRKEDPNESRSSIALILRVVSADVDQFSIMPPSSGLASMFVLRSCVLVCQFSNRFGRRSRRRLGRRLRG